LKITFIAVGSTKKAYLKAGIDDYVKRIGRYVKAQIIAVKQGLSAGKLPNEATRLSEAQAILKRIRPDDFVVVLDENGRAFSSKELADFMDRFMSTGSKGKTDLAFVVGGAFGVHTDVINRADMTLSLSRMTLAHELALLTLTEQVYRAYTIIKNEPYSH